MEIGIFGGSFNPIHNGHIILAETFLEQCSLDEVWLMVTPQNPFKTQAELLDDDKRLELGKQAVANYPKMKVSDYEFHLPKPSYTWNTLQSLKKDYPQTNFTLLIGGDNWAAFNRWSHAADILANYPIAIFPRRGYPLDKQLLKAGQQILQTPLLDISSSDIRRRIKQGESIDKMIPACILQQVRNLYL